MENLGHFRVEIYTVCFTSAQPQLRNHFRTRKLERIVRPEDQKRIFAAQCTNSHSADKTAVRRYPSKVIFQPIPAFQITGHAAMQH